MDPATISLIVDLGVKLATAEIERRAGKRLAAMNSAEVLAHAQEATRRFHAVTMDELEDATGPV